MEEVEVDDHVPSSDKEMPADVCDIIDVERASKEGGNIKFVLRSKGDPCLSHAAKRAPWPPFVVCLAHHHPSDVFILFVFTSHTIPCRLARFDRDGNILNFEPEESENGLPPFRWSDVDTAALMAAFNQSGECFHMAQSTAVVSKSGDEKGNASRNSPATINRGGADSSTTNEPVDRAEYIRLVPRVETKRRNSKHDESSDGVYSSEDEGGDDGGEDEARTIRSIIADEILSSPQQMTDVNFHHPDPKFLLPLSRSIAKELCRWRHLCAVLPPATEWPELPSSANAECHDKGMSEEEKRDFDEIKSERMSQLKKSAAFCQGALHRIESLLATIMGSNGSANDKDTTFQLGKECTASLVALEHLQSQHPTCWRECHDALQDAWIDHDGDSVLEGWAATGTFTLNMDLNNKYKQGENEHDGETEEDPTTMEGVIKTLIFSWVKEDQALLQALLDAVSITEKSLKHGDQEALQMAHKCTQSARKEVKSILAKARTDTIPTLTTLVKLWNEPCPDKEKEPAWLEDATWPRWKDDEVEAHLSFGWRKSESDREEHSTTTFSLDHFGLIFHLKSCINDLASSSNRNDDGHGGGYFEQEKNFDRRWEEFVQPTIDDTLSAAQKCLNSNDLRNASLLIACCCSVVCDTSMAGRIREWFDDPDGSYGSEKMINCKFQKTMRQLDVSVVKIALAYFDISLPSIEAGAHWFYDILRSGALFFPLREGEIHWGHKRSHRERDEPNWAKFSHPAAAVFQNQGWRHPAIICSTREDREKYAAKISDIEAPIIIKQRFNIMREQGKTQEAIFYAREASGDHECMHFLFLNGLANEALVQASTSCNVEGLGRLSKDLIASKPHASILCMQAHMLGSLEDIDEDNCHRIMNETIDNFVDLLRMKWLSSPDVAAPEKVDYLVVPSHVPSLYILSTISMARAFIRASESTSNMQALLENKHFKDSGVSLTVAAIAILFQMARPRAEARHSHPAIEYFLNEVGLMTVVGQLQVHYFGLLTQIGSVPVSMGKKVFIDTCCALYALAVELMKSGHESVICFDLALISATHLAANTGCQLFALKMVTSLQNLDVERFDEYTLVSPLNSLTACYAFLFSSNCTCCPQLMESLLHTFLTLKLDPSAAKNCRYLVNNDVRSTRIWVAIAYLQQRSAKEAAIHLIDCILQHQSYQSRGADVSLEKVVIDTLNKLLSIDQDTAEPNDHTMSAFVHSPERSRITESDRNQMVTAFIEKLLGSSCLLDSSVIAECVKCHKEINPSSWNIGAEQVEHRLSNLTGLSLSLQRKTSLVHTCTVMYYIDRSIMMNETWCDYYILLECGLVWLRNALSSDIVQFDNAETLGGQFYQIIEEDYRNLFREDNWQYRNVSYIPYDYSERRNRVLCKSPKLAAYGLITILRENILVVKEESPQLSHLCEEASALCCVLDFLLRPTPQRLNAVVAAQSGLGPREEELPCHLRPNKLVTLVLDCQWGTNPDFSIRKSVHGSHTPSNTNLVPRIATAIQCSKIEEAASLTLAGITDRFWAEMAERSAYLYEPPKMAREFLQCCLLILKAAIDSKDLSENFVNVSLHMIFSMNWLRVCGKCAPDSIHAPENSHKLFVTAENVSLLHEVAIEWDEVLDKRTDNAFQASLAYCLNAIHCLSRCIYICEENNLGNICRYCSFRQDDHGYLASSTESSRDQGGHSAREERARLRRKRKLQQKDSEDVESDFKKLLSFASQLHMKEASDWCKHALQRIKCDDRKKKKVGKKIHSNS